MTRFSPYVLAFISLFYFVFYLRLLGRIGLTGKYLFYANVGLILCMVIPPASVIFLYDDFNQDVIPYDPSVKLNAAYVSIHGLQTSNDSTLEYTSWRKTEDNDKVVGELEYFSVSPLIEPHGTANNVWIYWSHSKRTAWLKENVREDSVNAFAKVGRAIHDKVNFRTAKYFTNDYEGRLHKGWKILYLEGKQRANTIILNPSWRTLEEDRNSELIGVVVIYLLVFGITLLMTIPSDDSKKILNTPQENLS